MREPEVRYAKTSDGVNIAYWAIGEGPALVAMPNSPWSNVQAEWRSPNRASWFQRLAEGCKLVRYDHRGSGLSDRGVPVKSVEDMLGDASTQKVRRAHNKIVREALEANGGTETKHTGDGIMASFASTSQAVACAVAMQKAFAGLKTSAGEGVDRPEGATDGGIHVRIGLNAGEPIAEERDLFGTAVDLAARIRDKAEPGEILVSDVVRQLVAGKGFLFNDRGEHALKGFEDPVRVYEVRWRGDNGS